VTDVIGDDGVSRGASSPYRASAKRIEFDVVRLPVLTGPGRGLGAGPNGFAIESAIVASAAAIANAIRDATGHRTTRLPLTAQDLLRRHPT
jgi:isoquinoline 1-oxidoreductase subunit beta